MHNLKLNRNGRQKMMMVWVKEGCGTFETKMDIQRCISNTEKTNTHRLQ